MEDVKGIESAPEEFICEVESTQRHILSSVEQIIHDTINSQPVDDHKACVEILDAGILRIGTEIDKYIANRNNYMDRRGHDEA